MKNKIKNVLIISDKETQKNISKSVRNIPDVKLINDDGANVYDIVKRDNLIIIDDALKLVEERLL